MRSGDERERGQATVEFALLLPLFVLMVLMVLQASLVGIDWIRVQAASREGARSGAAALRDPRGSAREAVGKSSTLAADRTTVGVSERAQMLTVTVRYRVATDVPIVGVLLPDVDIAAQTTMYREESFDQ